MKIKDTVYLMLLMAILIFLPAAILAGCSDREEGSHRNVHLARCVSECHKIYQGIPYSYDRKLNCCQKCEDKYMWNRESR